MRRSGTRTSRMRTPRSTRRVIQRSAPRPSTTSSTRVKAERAPPAESRSPSRTRNTASTRSSASSPFEVLSWNVPPPVLTLATLERAAARDGAQAEGAADLLRLCARGKEQDRAGDGRDAADRIPHDRDGLRGLRGVAMTSALLVPGEHADQTAAVVVVDPRFPVLHDRGGGTRAERQRPGAEREPARRASTGARGIGRRPLRAHEVGSRGEGSLGGGEGERLVRGLAAPYLHRATQSQEPWRTHLDDDVPRGHTQRRDQRDDASTGPVDPDLRPGHAGVDDQRSEERRVGKE